MNTEKIPPSPVSGTSKQELIAFLEKEIEHIQSEITRPGWTNWAIIAGIATIIWLLYSEIESAKFDIDNILVLILAFSLVLPFIGFVIGRITRAPFTPYTTNDRYYYTKQENRTASMLLNLILVISGWAITKYMATANLQTHELVSYIFHSVFILISMIGFFISLINFPVPSGSELDHPRAKILLLFALCFALFGLSAAILYLYPLVVTQNRITIYDIRISSLAIAIFVLLRILAKTPQKTPMLEQLVRINRDLSLDRIESEPAKRQIDLAINGLRSGDIFQKYIDGYLNIMAQFDREIEQVRKKISVRNGLPKTKKDLSKESEIINESLEKDIAEQLSRLEKLLDAELAKHLLPLTKQMLMLVGASMFSVSNIKNNNDLISTLNDIKNGVTSACAELQGIKEHEGIPITNKEPESIEHLERILNAIKKF